MKFSNNNRSEKKNRFIERLQVTLHLWSVAMAALLRGNSYNSFRAHKYTCSHKNVKGFCWLANMGISWGEIRSAGEANFEQNLIIF
ncbi:MAG: hypothetical protein WCO48_01180 [Candidatus Taylorbacteria bacterium]